MAAPKPPVDPAELRRQGAGRHATGDGRFVVEQSSNGWMVTDAERTNELGLSLVRGPFATLIEAREAVAAARTGPLPISNLADRIAAIPKQRARPSVPARGAVEKREPVAPPPPVIREFRSRDGDGLRALWTGAGSNAVDIDDMRLRKFAQRNPGTFLVVTQADSVIGAGLGGWDGRYGWLHLLAVAGDHRRIGLGTQLVRRIEVGLEATGCRRVRVIDEGSPADLPFWRAAGYGRDESGYLAREIGAGASGAGGSTEPSQD
ncbi:MAG: GNAT family N-acetyltransferase [Chloroflexota bacterium]